MPRPRKSPDPPHPLERDGLQRRELQRMKAKMEEVFIAFYDANVSAVLAEIHCVFHARFAEQMANGPRAENYDHMMDQRAIKRSLRFASNDDVLSPTRMQDLEDEILDYLSCQDHPISSKEIRQFMFDTQGVDPEATLRVLRGLKTKELVKTNGTGVQYRITPAGMKAESPERDKTPVLLDLREDLSLEQGES